MSDPLPPVTLPSGKVIDPTHPEYWMFRFVEKLAEDPAMPKTTPEERQARMDAEDAAFVAQEAPEYAGDPVRTVLFDPDPFEDRGPGAPFWDETLNFLQTQYSKASAETGKLETKKYKLLEEIATKEREMAEIRELILHEWRERQPVNLETGEPISEPFSPVVFGGEEPSGLHWFSPDDDDEDDDDNGPDIDA